MCLLLLTYGRKQGNGGTRAPGSAGPETEEPNRGCRAALFFDLQRRRRELTIAAHIIGLLLSESRF